MRGGRGGGGGGGGGGGTIDLREARNLRLTSFQFRFLCKDYRKCLRTKNSGEKRCEKLRAPLGHKRTPSLTSFPTKSFKHFPQSSKKGTKKNGGGSTTRRERKVRKKGQTVLALTGGGESPHQT